MMRHVYFWVMYLVPGIAANEWLESHYPIAPLQSLLRLFVIFLVWNMVLELVGIRRPR